MNTSAFDIDTFLHQEVEGALDTTYTPVPEGEYQAYIDTIAAQTVNTADGTAPVLHVTYLVVDDGLKEELDMERPTVRQTLWLDLDEHGQLQMGTNKNVKLGRLREVVGQNRAGEAWSPSQLEGAGPLMILLGHRFSKDGEGPFAEIKKIAPVE